MMVREGRTADQMSDTERADPANARAWWCASFSYTTVVVAVCADEAAAIAAMWINRVRGPGMRQFVPGDVRVIRPATPDDVSRWLAARQQTIDGPRALR